ncbi:uncharacterized protein LTR77_004275 [Saxophila tyrrhenica]|uniref:Fungal STAND N-terminal Goodbye domain-containing protein n=1 Tax=Saxophila tyrrhenica TaxID=1690608 RepID=A0AAV9PCB4_9PEZI|nr:hypothetical protein LTR77_004275 [Saxophila tyrrhenica]
MYTISDELADEDLPKAWQNIIARLNEKTKWNLNARSTASIDQVILKINAPKDADPEKHAQTKKIWRTTMKCVDRLGVFVQRFGAIVAQAASVAFGPANQCFNAINFVITAAQQYKDVFNNITILMERISVFLETLNSFMDNNDAEVKLDKRLRRSVYRVLEHFLLIMGTTYDLTNSWTARMKFKGKSVAFGEDEGIKGYLATMETLVSDFTGAQISVIVDGGCVQMRLFSNALHCGSSHALPHKLSESRHHFITSSLHHFTTSPLPHFITSPLPHFITSTRGPSHLQNIPFSLHFSHYTAVQRREQQQEDFIIITPDIQIIMPSTGGIRFGTRANTYVMSNGLQDLQPWQAAQLRWFEKAIDLDMEDLIERAREKGITPWEYFALAVKGDDPSGKEDEDDDKDDEDDDKDDEDDGGDEDDEEDEDDGGNEDDDEEDDEDDSGDEEGSQADYQARMLGRLVVVADPDCMWAVKEQAERIGISVWQWAAMCPKPGEPTTNSRTAEML